MAVLRDVTLAFFAAHLVPNGSILLVPPDVVILGRNKQHQAKYGEGNQRLVAIAIVWLVVVSVNLRDALAPMSSLDTNRTTHVIAHDVAHLNRHIVQRCGHSPSPHRTGVAGCDCDDDRVDIRHADQKGVQHPARPRTGTIREDLEGDKKNQSPGLGESSQNEANVEPL